MIQKRAASIAQSKLHGPPFGLEPLQPLPCTFPVAAAERSEAAIELGGIPM
ncbi:hypothetical protein C4K08_0900 [Pseudomonas chlororaphis subsp. aureofaciens]|nr:hypothetical protein C4K08_0900 [Pseudomonas chlororaphis subsp. aureofaciens]